MNELSKAMSSSSSSGCDTAALHLILGSLVESTCGELLDACCVSTNPPNVDTVGSETISALHTVNMLLSDQAETDFDAVYPSAAECVEIITKNSSFTTAINVIENSISQSLNPPLNSPSNTSSTPNPNTNSNAYSLFDQLDAMGSNFEYIPPSNIIESYDNDDLNNPTPFTTSNTLPLLEKIEPSDLSLSEHWPKISSILSKGLSCQSLDAQHRSTFLKLHVKFFKAISPNQKIDILLNLLNETQLHFSKHKYSLKPTPTASVQLGSSGSDSLDWITRVVENLHALLRSDVVEYFSVAWDNQVNRLVLGIFSSLKREGGDGGIGFFEIFSAIDPTAKWFQIFSCRMNYIQLAHFVSRSRSLSFWKMLMERRGDVGVGVDGDAEGIIEIGAENGAGFTNKHFKKARLALAISMVRRTRVITRDFFDFSLPTIEATTTANDCPVAIQITEFKGNIYFAKEGRAEDGEEISLKDMTEAERVGLEEQKDANVIKAFDDWLDKFKIK